MASSTTSVVVSSAKTPLWLWPNILSLDAPVIASIWQNLFAHDVFTKLSLASRFVLPLSVWLIYLADRLFDTAPGRKPKLTARHAFSYSYRVFCQALAASAALLSAISVPFLPATIFGNGCAILTIVIAYLLIVHSMGGRLRHWLPKEAAVGLIFAIGSVLAPATCSANPRRLVFPALLFGILCWTNSAAIEIWEGGRADSVSRFFVHHIRLLALAVCTVCLLCGLWLPSEHSWDALLIAALGYTAIDFLRPDLSPDLLRVAIDIPLLSPLLLLGLK